MLKKCGNTQKIYIKFILIFEIKILILKIFLCYNVDMEKDKTVLCYIEQDNQYLMIYRNKKKNDLNEGKWLGIGGHIEQNETPDMALIREVKEETNLDIDHYLFRGIIYFQNDDYKEEMFLYTVDKFHGEIKECDEGDLHFISKDKICDLNIWEGDKIFLEYIKNNEPYFELELIYKGKKLYAQKRIK